MNLIKTLHLVLFKNTIFIVCDFYGLIHILLIQRRIIMQAKKGYVSFVLHAHLPFIHHPESDDFQKHIYHYLQIFKN